MPGKKMAVFGRFVCVELHLAPTRCAVAPATAGPVIGSPWRDGPRPNARELAALGRRGAEVAIRCIAVERLFES